MALGKTKIYQDAWTKIGDNVATITFQNLGANALYVEFTAADTAPTSTFGTIYNRFEGEMKKSLTDLTFTSSPAYVWVRSLTGQTTVIHEGA
tara:strand:- start:410 stop:685 length:276 start_codon:yes stop_codon:yes gene_type:complete